jgi:5-methylcytosine-specific restriction endonuclease McrA
MLQDKAEMVESGDRVIASASMQLQLPSVVKLNYYVNVPFESRVPLNRRSVLERDGGVCQYGCGRKATTIDHVVPRSRGGRHDWLNVLACCSRCNSKKADRLLGELGWNPIKKPHMPSKRVWLMSNVTCKEEWEPYLNHHAL